MKEIMKGKICVVTGANSGVGFGATIGLSRLGATVVMVCRNKERGERARERIKKKTSNESIDLMILDLASQQSIHQFATDFKTKYDRLDVLFNNAGVYRKRYSVTEDGIETTLAVNYLGHFMLTHLLLDILKKSAPSRIINVTANVFKLGTRLNLDDINGEREYVGSKAYAQTKLLIVLSTYMWGQKLKGTGVTANCFKPGIVRSNIIRDYPLVRLGWNLLSPFWASPEKGARCGVYLASASEMEHITGKYFHQKIEEMPPLKIYLGELVWELSMQLINMDTTSSHVT